MSSQLFIHIGYPKAASSSLQKNVFSKHPEINYLMGPTESSSWKNALPDQSAEEFWKDLTFSRNINNQKLQEKYKQSIFPYINNKLINIISFEQFTSPYLVDNQTTAKRLNYFFPNAKIIIILRNQFDILKSLYRYRPKAPLESYKKYERYLSFQEWMQINFDNYNRSFLSALNFYETAMLYSYYFGQQNIGVFLFEDLIDDIDNFTNQFSYFIKIKDQQKLKSLLELPPKNTSESSRYIALRSKIFPNISFSSILPKSIFYLLKNSALKIAEKTPNKLELTQEQSNQIDFLFRESNQQLAETFNLPLKDYNYPI